MNYRIFITFIIILMFTGCRPEKDTCHMRILINNESNKDIYVIPETHYPDTTYFGHFSSPISNAASYKVGSKSSSDRPLSNSDCWESDFGYDSLIRNDTLMIYVFDASIVENVDWSTITHDYLVIKRFDLSLSDLQKMDWTLIFK